MKKVISIALVLVALFSFCVLSVPMASAEEGVVYYVDSVGGNDSNNGTSATTAWKSLSKVNSLTLKKGETVKLKKGSVFNEQLAPNGRGESGKEIIITTYGEGAKPIIDVTGGNFESAIYISSAYTKVDGLVAKNRNGATERKGILISGTSNIVLKDCDVIGVDDASDRVTNKGSYGGLLGISIYRSFNTTVENNTVTNVTGSGIVSEGEYRAEAKGIVVRNNYLNGIGKDGILINNSKGALAEYNVVANSHNVSTAYHVAIWPFASDDALFQYNEAYGTKTTKDGHGFDCDYLCNRTIFQYNYAHDNEGGFMLICTEPTDWAGNPAYNKDVIIRYNIGQNNDNVQFALTGHIENTQIYNNTLYYDSGRTITTYIRNVKQNSHLGPNGTKFYNNIFYNVNGGGYFFSYTEGGVTGSCKGTIFENNAFYGKHPATEPDDSKKITADPRLENPGGAKTGLDTCVAYKLKSDSPLIKAGMLIKNNGGKDFFGNKVSAYSRPCVGAHEFVGTATNNNNNNNVNNNNNNNNQNTGNNTPTVSVKAPKKVTIKKVTPLKKSFKITWKKVSGIKGYKIKYSLKKNFKGAKTATVKAKATSKTIKKLKSKKKYFVKIAAYKKVNGVTYTGKYSKVKSVKIK